ncbi:MAG: TonB family protein [Vicinamibacterales bacterium]
MMKRRIRCAGIVLVVAASALAAQEGSASLWEFAAIGQIDAVRDRVERGAPAAIDAQDDLGWTPLMHAAGAGHDAVVRLLIDKGADLRIANKLGETALHLAVRRGRLEVARRLLAAGSDLAARDNEGRTALFKAIEGGHAAVIALLHAAAQARAASESPIRAVTPEGGTTPPTLVQWTDAPYTPVGLEKQIEGSVVLVALVRADGTVGALSVSRSLEPTLDQSALRTVRAWKFEPAQRAGVPVAIVVEVTVEFRLPKA